MQINGGRNNKFAAWADSGGLVMMYIPNNTADHPLWDLAQQNVLADNFFQSAFGGSYLNHQYLICSCAPVYPGDGTRPINPAAPTNASAAPAPSALAADGVTLLTSTTSPASALTGPPRFVASYGADAGDRRQVLQHQHDRSRRSRPAATPSASSPRSRR